MTSNLAREIEALVHEIKKRNDLMKPEHFRSLEQLEILLYEMFDFWDGFRTSRAREELVEAV